MSPSQAHIRALVYPLIHRRHRNRLAPSGKIREARDAELLLHNVFWNPSADAELTRRDPLQPGEVGRNPQLAGRAIAWIFGFVRNRKLEEEVFDERIWLDMAGAPRAGDGVRVRDALAVGLEDVRGLIQLLDVAIRPLPRHVVYVVPFVLYGTFRDCEVCTEVVGNIWNRNLGESDPNQHEASQQVSNHSPQQLL